MCVTPTLVVLLPTHLGTPHYTHTHTHTHKHTHTHTHTRLCIDVNIDMYTYRAEVPDTTYQVVKLTHSLAREVSLLPRVCVCVVNYSV